MNQLTMKLYNISMENASPRSRSYSFSINGEDFSHSENLHFHKFKDAHDFSSFRILFYPIRNNN